MDGDDAFVLAFAMILGILMQHHVNGSPFLASLGVVIGIVIVLLISLIVERRTTKKEAIHQK